MKRASHSTRKEEEKNHFQQQLQQPCVSSLSSPLVSSSPRRQVRAESVLEAMFIYSPHCFSIRIRINWRANVFFTRRRDFLLSHSPRSLSQPRNLDNNNKKADAAFPFPPLPSLVSSESDLPSSSSSSKNRQSSNDNAGGAMPAGTRAGPVEWDQVLKAAREGRLNLDTERETGSSSSSSSASAASADIAAALQERLNGNAAGASAAPAAAAAVVPVAPAAAVPAAAAAAPVRAATATAAAAASAPATASAGRRRSRHLMMK